MKPCSGWLRSGAVALLIVGAGVGAEASPAEPLPPLIEGGHLGAGWTIGTLPHQTKAVTRFSVDRVDGRSAVQLQAEASYGNLVRVLPGSAAPARLRWSWRLQQPNPGTDLRQKSGDDLAARVCLSFDLPLDRLGFAERQKLRIAREISGEVLPSATLCWVWGAREAVGTLFDSPFTRRLRYLVVRNAGDPLATWLDENRDIAADFKRAFGDEASELPPLILVGIGADADNTGASTVSQIADLRFAD